jgi:hypothetical protein
MLQAANKPEKIAALRASYENAVRAGWADAAQLEWLDSEADVLRRAPHLAGADIAVRTPMHPRAGRAALTARRAGRPFGAAARAGQRRRTRSSRSGASSRGSACA